MSTHAVFAHDHVFVRDVGGEQYTTGKLPYRTWQRYLSVFSSLTVIARERPARLGEDLSRMDRASGPSVSFAPMPNLSSLAGLLGRRAAVSRAIQAMAGAEIVIARVPSEVGTVAIEAARQTGKLVALEVVGCAWDALRNHGSLVGTIYAPWAYWTLRRQTRGAKFALYVSRSFLQDRYPTKGRTVACSNVEVARVSDGVLETRLTAMSEGRPATRVGLIGSLETAYKGIDTAIAAVAELAPSHPDLTLQIVGNGNPAPWHALAARAGVSERVRFLGVLPAGEAVHAWLRTLDLYIQPSRQEGLPRALVEAMAHGCPCVGSSAGGIPELLEVDSLHPPGDFRALAALIGAAASDSVWRTRQAVRNFSEAARYSSDRLNTVRTAFWMEVARAART